MTQQPQTEGRITWRIGLALPGRQGPHQPARRRRAGRRLRRGPQQQGHDAGSLGRQSQAPAGGEIELARLAPGLDQRRAERRAASRLGPGAQHTLGVAGPHQQHLRGIEAELGEAGRVQAAGLDRQEILPDPEQGPPARGSQGQSRGEAGRGGQVGPAGRIDLVQGGAGDAAAQRSIQPRHTEIDPLHRREFARQPRQGEALPEASQGARRSIGHGSSVHYLFRHKTTPKPRWSQARICGTPFLPGWRDTRRNGRQQAELSPIAGFLSYQGNADRLAAGGPRHPSAVLRGSI